MVLRGQKKENEKELIEYIDNSIADDYAMATEYPDHKDDYEDFPIPQQSKRTIQMDQYSASKCEESLQPKTATRSTITISNTAPARTYC